jgi:hypothetical protein
MERPPTGHDPLENPQCQSATNNTEKRDNSRENDKQLFLSSRKPRKTRIEAGGKNSPSALFPVKNEGFTIRKSQ